MEQSRVPESAPRWPFLAVVTCGLTFPIHRNISVMLRRWGYRIPES